MLTEQGCRARRERLWKLAPAELEWIVITDPRHLIYFAAFAPSPFVFNTQGAGGSLILGRDGSAILVADNVQEPYADAAFVTERVLPVWYRCVEAAGSRLELLAHETLKRLLDCPGNAIGYEAPTCPAALADGIRASRAGVQLVNIEPLIHQLRRAKDPDEVALIRRALIAATAGLRAAMHEVRPGLTELDVYRLVQRAAGEAAGRQVLIYGDFVSGARCDTGGGVPSGRTIQAGELVLLDFSAVIDGYRGDFCNTFVCHGQPSAKQREMFEACAAAMTAGEQQLRPGVPAKQVFAAVRHELETRGYAKYFPHHAGHGIGLGHPEAPFFVPESSETVVVGDVVTLEPGLYIPDVGGMRFERDYLITATGFESLSDHPIGFVE
ncbi:MAG: aminopeptidase P family protein [Planctomycetes bacterium]|nr:aminopeptidase P family protein [Planctomycetota bacterium]